MLSQDDLSLLTYKEAAELVGQDPATIRQWVSRYGLKTVKDGRRRLVSEADVLDCNLARAAHPRHRESA